MPSELLQKTISKARPRKGQCKESWYSNVPWETQLEMTRIENAHWNSSNEHVDNNYISTVKFLQLLCFRLGIFFRCILEKSNPCCCFFCDVCSQTRFLWGDAPIYIYDFSENCAQYMWFFNSICDYMFLYFLHYLDFLVQQNLN